MLADAADAGMVPTIMGMVAANWTAGLLIRWHATHVLVFTSKCLLPCTCEWQVVQ